MNRNPWIAVGAISGALTVALGAFGAHALEDSLEPSELEIWRTAVLYQGLHSIALVLHGLHSGGRRRSIAAWAFLIGVLVFSGTLYAMALGGPRWLGAITPLGGTALIVGWIAFAIEALRGGAST